MRSPKVGNQGETFSSAFVDRTVQHSAWPIVRVDLPQVVCLGAAPRNAAKKRCTALFLIKPGIEPRTPPYKLTQQIFTSTALTHSVKLSDP